MIPLALLQMPLLMGGWASYPPVQDAGYDPSFALVQSENGNTLMRTVRPVSHGPMRIGFIKRINRLAAPSLRVSFAYRLQPEVPGGSIEIGFAGRDAHRYAVAHPATGAAWSNAQAEFPAIPPGTGLEAIYVVAVVPDADPTVEYRLSMSGLTLDAPSPASLELLVPVARSIPPWPALIAESTYAPGETIRVEARSSLPIKSIGCVLEDQDAKAIATRPLRREGTLWKAVLHTVLPGDATGVWRIQLTAQAEDGRAIHNTVRLIVRPPRANVHPRLFFAAADRNQLLERTRQPGFNRIWAQLLSRARQARAAFLPAGDQVISLLDTRYLLPSLPAYFGIVTAASDQLRLTSLEAWITAGAAARAGARSTLLAVANWNRWAPPWFEANGFHCYYPEGQLAIDVSLAYDLLYPGLTASERALVRRTLTERGIRDPYREYVLDDRLIAGTSNWLGHSIGGALVAGMAVTEGADDPELNRYLGGLLQKFEEHLASSYLADGSYGESLGYQQFDLKSTTQALEALKRVWGIDYWRHSHVKDALEFPLYTLAQPPSESQDMGDGHGQDAYASAPILHRSADPALRWFYNHFQHRSFLDLLFPPTPGSGQIEQRPPSHVFDRKGFAVFRTGWKPDDAILQFRAGPHFNHNHADQGSFLLHAFGEDLASEAGASHYYNDPYYPTWFSQAAGHNVMLINGDPASQDLGDTTQFAALHAMARMTDAITSSAYDAAGAELSPVYRGRLNHYRRRIVFLKPSLVLIYDDLESRGAPATFDWQLHVKDKNRLALDGGVYRYRAARGAMTVRPLQPAGARISVSNGRLPFSTFNPAAPKTVPAAPGVLTLESRANRFLVALELEPGTSKPPTERLEGEACIGARAGALATLFRQHGRPTAMFEGWRTDAETWTFDPATLAAAGLTTLTHNGQSVFESDHRVTFAATLSPGKVHLDIAATRPTAIRWNFGLAREFTLQAGLRHLDFSRTGYSGAAPR